VSGVLPAHHLPDPRYLLTLKGVRNEAIPTGKRAAFAPSLPEGAGAGCHTHVSAGGRKSAALEPRGVPSIEALKCLQLWLGIKMEFSML
jgi:hypothetical protein